MLITAKPHQGIVARMYPVIFGSARRLVAAFVILCICGDAVADPQHGIAMYGAPALPHDFVSLPYANPDAPKGGQITFGETGGFDSLNPFILRGRAPFAVARLTVETLLGRSYDEPFTLYGLLAESVDTDPARSWVEFTLRPGARFSDGAPVTVDDVLWSFEVLGTKGNPRYLGAWSKVARAEQTGPRSVRFTFTAPDRELPLILGLRPILQKAQWQGRAFDQSGLTVPVGSGPYVIAGFDAGRSITFRKDPDWWGADLPFNRGQHNFDAIRYEYFADAGALFQAFKAGEIDLYRENNPARWNDSYDFDRLRSGAVVRDEIPHHRPSGMAGLVFNTRRAIFADWRVREALIAAFNFPFINNTLNGGQEPRITSYFANSPLAMRPGPALGRVRALLAPFADSLPPGAMEGYSLPVADGSLSNRAGLRAATDLLQEAGWRVRDGALQNAAGAPFTFEVLLEQGSANVQAMVNIYVAALRRLGITVRITTVDSAQYFERTSAYDFDMTYFTRSLSLSPGNEQWLYWGSQGATNPGTRNLMGVASPAVDAMITHLLTSANQDDFLAAARALDRLLTAGRYAIPIWYSDVSRIAHNKELRYPRPIPLYGDWLGFLPEVWWQEE
jgi:peptide/nickel transport system substrate-binding protein